ncbi:MAG TPA: FAD binding domain-containing protein [Burkholderiales bacterium]|nr:FAD binding domain-containing protein [Burkholderiales bacterium]
MAPGRAVGRATVVGGSLGGLFAANLLYRAGWDVRVFEHSREDLVARGAGIITHPELFSCLSRIGIALDESFGVDIPERVAFGRDGSVLGTLPVRQCLTTWGRLYELLRSAFPTDRYHLDHSFERLHLTPHTVTARFANGAAHEAELLIGADGIRSKVRAELLPQARPRYAGYVAWRGLADERTLAPAVHRDLFPRFGFSLAEREHMLGYPVAGFTRSTRPGERCYNFVWYRPADEAHVLPDLCTDVRGQQHDMSVPPPLIRPEIVQAARRAADDYLSPQFAEVVRQAPQPFFQAIFDLESPAMSFDRVALLGDAAFVARPHCGMGVTKAAGDAMKLVDLLVATGGEVPTALANYDQSRRPFGAAVVEHGRDLGSYLEGTRTEAARRHHTAEAVMREIAVTRDYL